MIGDFMQAVCRDLAPQGTLRVALNFGNPVMVQCDGPGVEPRGLAVDLADELARRLSVPRLLSGFDGTASIDAGLARGWDVAFFSIELARARNMDCTAPYVVLESTYLVRDDSRFRCAVDLDQDGVRIAVGAGGFYDLHLTRTLKNARLHRAPTFRAAVELFLREGLEAVAGLKQPLVAVSKASGGLRLIEGRFAAVEQVIGLPKGRSAGLRYLNAFVEQMKSSGRIAAALRNSAA